jgi:hypothetical protein
MGASPTSPTPESPASSTPMQHDGSRNSGNTSPTALPVHAHVGPRTSGLELETRRHWMPKMEFPRFDGSDVLIWLDKCSAYFQLYQIPSDFRVAAAFCTWLTRHHTGSRCINILHGFILGSILYLLSLGNLRLILTELKPWSF